APPLGAAREVESLPPSFGPAAASFSSGGDPEVLLVRVYASAVRDDEFVEIENDRDEALDLTGWTLSDGEAAAAFPVDSSVPAKGRILVTRNATSYGEDTLAAADFTFDRGEARAMEGGVLRLADAGDEILLLDAKASVLGDAARRGVRVRVLLDGGPVGGIDSDEHNVSRGLAAAGVDVRWMTGGKDIVKRYRFLHAKYALVDASAAWIGSENFGESGFPDGRKGNRGWSVVLEDAALTRALGRVFESDFDPRRRDTVAQEDASEA